MELSQFIKKYNAKNKLPLPERHAQEVEASRAVQIHSTGARPSYYSQNLLVVPETYQQKFDMMFKQRLLNRHPNEADGHYNWRLSVYAPVAKELFDKFLNMCKGSILQPNNFSINADEATMQYLSDTKIHHELSEMIEFIMENPYGYFAVIIEGEREMNEEPEPEMVCIPAENILMRDKDSVAFTYEGNIYYLNEFIQAEITNIKTGEYIEYQHNFDDTPCWKYHNSFMQPFQFWADLLVRNMNDDEAVTKHYSYPKIQQVLSECPTCLGQKRILDTTAPPLENGAPVLRECTSCRGSGYITNNPGDYITVAEETIQRNGGTMPDYVRFITPDIGIPEFHLKRWQVFYQRTEQSLFLRPVNEGVQSGEAKQEDRKDQYIFLQSISNFLFEQVEKGLKYISMYVNVSNEPGPISVVMPKQFDLMSDSDLVNEFADLQKKTDDPQTLGELNLAVNNKVFRDNSLQKRISDVLYFADTLYGISGEALKMKYLSGIYTDAEKILHEKGYKLLVNMARDMGEEAFLSMETSALINRLNEAVASIVPQTIYAEPI